MGNNFDFDFDAASHDCRDWVKLDLNLRGMYADDILDKIKELVEKLGEARFYSELQKL